MLCCSVYRIFRSILYFLDCTFTFKLASSSVGVFLITEFCNCVRIELTSGVPRNFFRGGSTNSVEDRGQRERGSGGSSPLVRGSGGSCSLVQEISFHIVKFSQFLVL